MRNDWSARAVVDVVREVLRADADAEVQLVGEEPRVAGEGAGRVAPRAHGAGAAGRHVIDADERREVDTARRIVGEEPGRAHAAAEADQLRLVERGAEPRAEEMELALEREALREAMLEREADDREPEVELHRVLGLPRRGDVLVRRAALLDLDVVYVGGRIHGFVHARKVALRAAHVFRPGDR